MTSSILASEINESANVVAAIGRSRQKIRDIAKQIRGHRAPLCVVCGRGSSGHAGVFLRYLVETRLRIPVSFSAPSVITAFRTSLILRHALFVVISQSGRSPDLIAATRSARGAGARTIAIVNDTSSPVADEAEFVLPIEAGIERSVAATKTVIGSMAASIALVAELGEDSALRSAFERLPERLHRALRLDWSEIGDDVRKAAAVFVAARGLGLGSAREIALKFSEVLRVPSIGLSAAELQHGPRAALSLRTPILLMRLKDGTAATVDAVAEELRRHGIPLHVCGGPLGSLPWLAEDDPATDPITMLVPAYRMIEQTARTCGFDPDRPPGLSKITETT